jgi:hypothetical protein
MDARLEVAIATSRTRVSELASALRGLSSEISWEVYVLNLALPENVVFGMDEPPEPFKARRDAIQDLSADLKADEGWVRRFTYECLKNMFQRRLAVAFCFRDYPAEISLMIVDLDQEWMIFQNGPNMSLYTQALDGGLPPIEGGILLHECDMCWQKFGTRREFIRHLQTEHECDVCGGQFTTREERDDHSTMVHEGEHDL